MAEVKSCDEKDLLAFLQAYKRNRISNGLRGRFRDIDYLPQSKTVSWNEYKQKIKPLLQTDYDAPGAPGIDVSDQVDHLYGDDYFCLFRFKGEGTWYILYTTYWTNHHVYHCDKYSTLAQMVTILLERDEKPWKDHFRLSNGRILAGSKSCQIL